MTARQLLDKAITEAEFSANVARLAKLRGWLAYHTHDSRRSEQGFPDWVFVRPPRVIYAELKRQTGKATEAQTMWLEALRKCHQEAYLWRPSDWIEVETMLE